MKNVIIGALLLLTFIIGGCVGDDGKERNDKGNGDHALDSIADPQDDQGGNGDYGDGLQKNGVGVEAALNESRLRKNQGYQKTEGEAECKTQQCA